MPVPCVVELVLLTLLLPLILCDHIAIKVDVVCGFCVWPVMMMHGLCMTEYDDAWALYDGV